MRLPVPVVGRQIGATGNTTASVWIGSPLRGHKSDTSCGRHKSGAWRSTWRKNKLTAESGFLKEMTSYCPGISLQTQDSEPLVFISSLLVHTLLTDTVAHTQKCSTCTGAQKHREKRHSSMAWSLRRLDKEKHLTSGQNIGYAEQLRLTSMAEEMAQIKELI